MLGGARAASPTLRSQMEEAGLTASSSSGRLSPHRAASPPPSAAQSQLQQALAKRASNERRAGNIS